MCVYYNYLKGALIKAHVPVIEC